MDEIIIENYTNHQKIPHSLIVLKGHIEFKEQQSKKSKNIDIFHNDTKNTTILIENRFKFVIQLVEGQNKIELNHSQTTLKINLIYEKRKTNQKIKLLYIVCKNDEGKFQAPPNMENTPQIACQKIDLCAKMLQTVFGEKLKDFCEVRKTFEIDGECQIFRSELTVPKAQEMNQSELWEFFGREIMTSEIGDTDRKYLAFLSCTRYGENVTVTDENTKTHNDILKLTKGFVALGGGGLALFHTGCFYTWPTSYVEINEKFQDTTIIDKKALFDDSSYRGTFGACFATTLGAVLHELSHVFDLGHTQSGIMARGFDNIDQIFTLNAATLQSSAKVEQIHFEENLTKEKPSECQLDKKKSTKIMKKDQNNDIFWTDSCLNVLNYHKWFNVFPPNSNRFKFDAINHVIQSTNGLRVIEIRKEINEMVIFNWVFAGKVLKYQFSLPKEAIEEKKCILFVVDNFGNIFKQTLH